MSDDLISRQAAIDALEALTPHADKYVMPEEKHGFFTGIAVAERQLQLLPSAEPERKRGRWVETEAAPHRIYCSECFKTYIPNKEWYAWKEDIVPKNFCPNCGAKMEG